MTEKEKDSAKVKTIPPLIPLFFIGISWLLDKYVYHLGININQQIQTYVAYVLIAIAVVLFSFSLYFLLKLDRTRNLILPQMHFTQVESIASLVTLSILVF